MNEPYLVLQVTPDRPGAFTVAALIDVVRAACAAFKSSRDATVYWFTDGPVETARVASADLAAVLQDGRAARCDIVSAECRPQWSARLSTRETYNLGMSFVPALNLVVRVPAYLAAASRMTGLVDRLIDAVDKAGGVAYGFIDYDDGNQIRYGSIFTNLPIQPLDWRMWVTIRDFNDAANRPARHVRDLYWGNFFGPEQHALLGESVLEDYRAFRDANEFGPTPSRRLGSGGMFLALSATPVNCFEFSPELDQSDLVLSGVWLKNRLRNAGMW